MDSFKKIIIPILLVIVFIVVAGALTRKMQGLTPFPFKLFQTPPPKEAKIVKIDSVSIKVEVAETDQEKQKGLSGKKSLAKDSGMLFIISSPNSIPSFWMKDTKFPIDIIWILSSSGDVRKGKIIQIEKNAEVPKAGTPDNKLKLYSPKSAVDSVLEVNAGFSDANSFKVGDSVLIE